MKAGNMKNKLTLSFCVLCILCGCSLDPAPPTDACPEYGIKKDGITVYVYRDGVNNGQLSGDFCPEESPVCGHFSADSEFSGSYFCMEDCSKQYCE